MCFLMANVSSLFYEAKVRLELLAMVRSFSFIIFWKVISNTEFVLIKTKF